MPYYMCRCTDRSSTRIHRFSAETYAEAGVIARRSARGLGPGWTATALNLVEKFRLRPAEQVFDLDAAAIPGAPRETADGVRPLDEPTRRELSALALRGLRLALSPGMRRLGMYMVDKAIWLHTADALVNGEYRRDAVKLDLGRLPHTAAAAEAIEPKELRHEHVVPRSWLVKHLLARHAASSEVDETAALDEIRAALGRCPPVIVSRHEARRLDARFRSDMPRGWKFGDDPFRRYVEVEIIRSADDLVFPERSLWSREGHYRSSE